MYAKKTQLKYKNRKVKIEGYVYDSQLEANYAAGLILRQKARDIKSWEKQKKIELYGENGTKVCNYFIDFMITHLDGRIEYIEVKGLPTAVWSLKFKLMKDKFKNDPNILITLVTKKDI